MQPLPHSVVAIAPALTRHGWAGPDAALSLRRQRHLVGSRGDDDLYGDGGVDIYVFRGDFGYDLVVEDGGRDTLQDQGARLLPERPLRDRGANFADRVTWA